jgi:hypothetical protein
VSTRWLLLCAALVIAPAAALADDAVPAVQVNGIKDPEMRSYRSTEKGLDAFDDYRALAPQATLRFVMRRRNGGPADASDGLQLRLASDDGRVEERIPMSADGMFVLARSQPAHDADASFILNKKNGQYTALPDVRTPGLPENVRRLGDLRLECRVTVAILKDQIPFLARAAINTLLLTGDWCGKDKVNMGLPSAHRLAVATLRAGERTRVLDSSTWKFKAPIGDRDWPDDALVELKYEDDPAQDATPQPAPAE